MDIQLRDSKWEGARLTPLAGAAEAKVAALAPGANATHTYTLRATAAGIIAGGPAQAQYRDASSKKPQARRTVRKRIRPPKATCASHAIRPRRLRFRRLRAAR